jgi:hypothetical protein
MLDIGKSQDAMRGAMGYVSQCGVSGNKSFCRCASVWTRDEKSLRLILLD